MCSDVDDFNIRKLFLTANIYLNKVIDVIKFAKHFLNSLTIVFKGVLSSVPTHGFSSNFAY